MLLETALEFENVIFMLLKSALEFENVIFMLLESALEFEIVILDLLKLARELRQFRVDKCVNRFDNGESRRWWYKCQDRCWCLIFV